MSRSRRGPLPRHLGGAARPAPASGLGGEQPPGAAERDSPRRRRRRSWRCCCSCGARPGFSSDSLPLRAAASLFLAPPPPLPPPPLPPPLRPRRGARGWRARDGRRHGCGARAQAGRGGRAWDAPAPSLRLPGCPSGRHQPSVARLPRVPGTPLPFHGSGRFHRARPRLAAGSRTGREAVALC